LALTVVVRGVCAQVKGRAGSSVVDMSLLWLWWVVHHRHLPAGWATGRPFALDTTETPLPADLAAHRAKSDAAFEYAKTLEVPRPAATLRLCNGMDAVDRYACVFVRAFLLCTFRPVTLVIVASLQSTTTTAGSPARTSRWASTTVPACRPPWPPASTAAAGQRRWSRRARWRGWRRRGCAW